MSRHKIIKNLDLDEELDVYDGGDDYEYGYKEGADAAPGDVGGACCALWVLGAFCWCRG
jgi:hypothetical protein